MADVTREHSSKSKNNRAHTKEKHKERKHSSHHKDNDIENDSKHDFRTNHKKDSSYKDSKQKFYDRNDRKHDERKIHFTQPQDDRYISYRSDDRNHSSTPSYRRDRHESVDDGYRNSLSNNDRYSNQYAGNAHGRAHNETRYDDRRTNDERFVTFNRSSSSNNDECVGSLWQKIDYLSNQVDDLTQENERLRYNVNMRHNVHDDPHSEVTISFRNKDLEERFLPILTELASDLIQGLITVDEIRDIKFSKSNSLDDREGIKDLPEGELFQLDNSTAEPDENPHVPKYETSFAEVLEDEDGKIKLNEKSEKPKFRKVCFNCGEDHMISKCPHKINYYKVANAKKQQRERGPPPTVRYHLNKEQGESGFKPGVLSNELRDALGLKTGQIPPYVYRMRLINYPPGWLQEAMVESSGIAVYDSGGSELRNESGENAELTMNRSEIRYDPAKFIDFPGFNVPLPPDFVDESYELGFPPMQEHQMRSHVEENMPKAEIRPNRKRKLQLTIETSTKIQRFEEDMDLDEDLGETFFQFTPPLPQDAPPPPPPEEIPEPPPDVGPEPPHADTPELPPEETTRIVASHDSDSGTNTPMSDSIMEVLAPVVERFKMAHSDSADAHSSSPSLKELEEIKKRLVMELGSVSECPSPSIQDDSQPNTSDAEELNRNTDSRGSFTCQDSSNDLSNFSDCSLDSSLAETGQSTRKLQRSQSVCSKSKLMTLGTPSLSRHSSYQKLPDYDKFAQNVTSHINFENLPNSTGTYEKMKNVLKKVKEKFNALMP